MTLIPVQVKVFLIVLLCLSLGLSMTSDLPQPETVCPLELLSGYTRSPEYESLLFCLAALCLAMGSYREMEGAQSS